MQTTDEIIKICKKIIKDDDITSLKEYYSNLNEIDIFISNVVAYEYIYQKIFLHACINKKREIIEWLMDKYEKMDNIRKIGLRQMFYYGKYLLKKYKMEDISWYDKFLDNKIKILPDK